MSQVDMRVIAVAVVLGLGSLALCCPQQQDVSDGCHLPPGMTITSSPSRIVLNDQHCNSSYAKTEWQELPKVSFPSANKDGKYAILMIDPDAINTPKGKNYWHWLAANIPGQELITGDWNQNYDLLKYKGPGPPKGTGIHKYQFVLYEYEDSKSTLALTLANKDRPQFHLGSWLKSVEDQVKLCGPVAGLQFLSRY